MSQHTVQPRIPRRLGDCLLRFRRTVRSQVIAFESRKSLLAALVATLSLFIVDRFFETPWTVRALIAAVVFATAIVSLTACVRILSQTRSLLRCARWIRSRGVPLGDEILGVLELAGEGHEKEGSPALRLAALSQVSERIRDEDLRPALPNERRVSLRAACLFTGILALVVTVFLPHLTLNALQRWIMPWKDLPRVTLTSLRKAPETMVVPLGEASQFEIAIDRDSVWRPKHASVRGKDFSVQSQPLTADATYPFQWPRLLEPETVQLKIGDAFHTMQMVPKPRPKVRQVRAEVLLPAYLRAVGVSNPRMTLTDNTMEVLRGSGVNLEIETSSPVGEALVNGDVTDTRDQTIFVHGDPLDERSPEAAAWTLRWTDEDGLSQESPLRIRFQTIDDRPPTVHVRHPKIEDRMLQEEVVPFQIHGVDDFAVRRMGVAWRNATKSENADEAGWQERPIPIRVGQDVTVESRFQPLAFGAAAGKQEIRFWVEDDRPGAARVYSPTIPVHILSSTEHAIWVDQQLARWRQGAMELHDQELRLFETNRALSKTPSNERDAQWRNEVGRQAQAERQNARRIVDLAAQGRKLLAQAGRNREIEAEQVQAIAESIVELESLAFEKMPQTAKLLESVAQTAPNLENDNEFEEIMDVESSLTETPTVDAAPEAQSPSDASDEPDPKNGPRLNLAGTTIVDQSKSQPNEQDAKPTQNEAPEVVDLKLAVEDHAEVVAAFDRIAEQLQTVMKGLQESTLVKRLKSASRRQDRVAAGLDEHIESTFGANAPSQEELSAVVNDQTGVELRVRTIVDDLEAFCERRDIELFVNVLNEMQSSDVLSRLRDLREGLGRRPGASITEAEYWAARLDQWADNLVPEEKEQPDGQSKSPGKRSVPPKIILEVLRVLESEVELREQTRGTEQRRETVDDDQHMAAAIRLSEAQDLLRDRLDVIVDSLQAEPQGELNFAGEIEVLSAASQAMNEATQTLQSRETGAPAIAAETEAIELMLQSNKIKPDDSGSGSASSSQAAATKEAAMQLLEEALNPLAKQRRGETETSIGRSRDQVPERLREPVRRFFDQLEQRRFERDSTGQRPRP